MERKTPTWPVLLLCLPAFVAIWGGWVGLGELTGFGVVNLLPGMVPDGGWATINTAITLPIGLETYAAYSLHVSVNAPKGSQLRSFSGKSAIAALLLGGGGQVAYHLMESMELTRAPLWVTAIVGSLPVVVLGLGTRLASLARQELETPEPAQDPWAELDRIPEVQEDLTEDTAPTQVLPEVPVSPAPARVRKDWDPAKVYRLTLERKDQDIADLVGLSAKTVQRVRRAGRILQDLTGVSDQDVATTCKLTAVQVAAIRKEALA